VEGLRACIRDLILADHPEEQLNRLSHAVEEGFPRAPSKTPMTTSALGRLEPTPALKDRAEMAYTSG
jgi:hypothetical protein